MYTTQICFKEKIEQLVLSTPRSDSESPSLPLKAVAQIIRQHSMKQVPSSSSVNNIWNQHLMQNVQTNQFLTIWDQHLNRTALAAYTHSENHRAQITVLYTTFRLKFVLQTIQQHFM
jgi:hypothetical protein